MDQQNSFNQWCVVEIFGHKRIAGLVSEQAIGGQSFVRVDVPAVGDQAAFTQMFGAGAIYSIIPTTQEIATAFAARNVGAPISPYDIKQPALPKPDDDNTDDTNVDDDPGW